MSQVDRVVDVLVADHERAGGLSWDQIHRVTQRRGLDSGETARVLEELHDLGLLPDGGSLGAVGIVRERDEDDDSETETSKPLVDGLGVFMSRAAATPLLRPEDEVTLARRMRAGEAAAAKPEAKRTQADQRFIDEGMQAKAQFIEANLRLVFAWARRAEFQGQGLEYEDLIQAGILGLIRAVEKFDVK